MNGLTSSTNMNVGQVVIPAPITVNKVTIRVDVVSVAGTMDISLYTEDGQTQVFSVTTASISSAGFKTTAVSSVLVQPGIYYIAINSNSTANLDIAGYTSSAGSNNNFVGWSTLSSEPTLEGSVTITADTPPATITPESISSAVARTLVIRLDN